MSEINLGYSSPIIAPRESVDYDKTSQNQKTENIANIKKAFNEILSDTYGPIQSILVSSKSDGYIPLPILNNNKIDVFVTNKKVNDIISKADNIAPAITATVLNIMGPIMRAESRALEAMGEILDQFLKVFDLTSSILNNISKSTFDFLKAQSAKAVNEAREATKKKGIFAMIFGFIEVAIGVLSIAMSIGASVGTFGAASIAGGIGVAAGVLAVINGVSKIAGGIAAVADPDGKHTNGKLADKLMADGIFGLFGDNSALIGQIVTGISVLLGGVSGMASAGAAVVGVAARTAMEIAKVAIKVLAPAIFNIANTLSTLIGNIGDIIDSALKSGKDADKDAETDGKTSVWKAMSMGIASMLMVQILEIPEVKEALKDSLGDIGAMITEMVIYFVTALAAAYGLNAATQNSSFKDAAKNGFAKNPNFSKLFNAAPSANGDVSTTKLQKVLKTASDLIKGGTVVSTVDKIGNSGFNIIKSLNQVKLTNIDVETEITTLLLAILKQNIESADNVDRDVNGIVTKNMHAFAKSSTDIVDTFEEILNGEIKFAQHFA
ncbi:MAG: hypothetical protein LW807_05795 [Proteobacteria bacterium]|jgi:hypothetical protein|nr:hypothetical protein [Pseudomonadota bacterium]